MQQKKELQDFFQPERDRKNKLARLNRKWRKEAEEKKRQEEQQDILDFTPIDIERKTKFTMLKEELACCEQVGFDSIN